MRKAGICCWLGCLMLMALGCAKDTQPAVIPTFIEVPSVQVVTDARQGTTQHQITEVTAYADSQLIGTFPVPGTFPLLVDGSFALDLFAGIRVNGQAATPGIYPFFPPSRQILTADPGQVVRVQPLYRYASEARFVFVEEFSDIPIFEDDLDGDRQTSLTVVTEGPLIEGPTARGTVSAEHPDLEVATRDVYTLPTNGSSAYLELQYRSDVPVWVGLRGHGSVTGPASAYILVLFPAGEARKVYVDLRETLQASALSGYQVIFMITFDPALGVSPQHVWLDNLKLLHF